MNPSRPFRKICAFSLFARRIAALAAPYFRSEEKWKARGCCWPSCCSTSARSTWLVQFNDWYRVFYDALKNATRLSSGSSWAASPIWPSAFIIIAVYKFYLTQLLQMRWRGWMTRDYLQPLAVAPCVLQDGAGAFSAASKTPPTSTPARTRQPGPADSGRRAVFHHLHDFTEHGLAQCGRDAGQFCRPSLGSVGSAGLHPGRHQLQHPGLTWSGPRCSTAWSAACWRTTSGGR
jgi:hypothetical protein